MSAPKAIPPFAIVPTHALGDRDLLESDLRVLGVLCAFRNRKTGDLFPSQGLIGLAAGYTPVTVRAALKRLRKRGYIDWEERYRDNGGKMSHQYQITFFAEDEEYHYGNPSVSLPPIPQANQGGDTPRVPGEGIAVAFGLPETRGYATGTEKLNREVEQRIGTSKFNTADPAKTAPDAATIDTQLRNARRPKPRQERDERTEEEKRALAHGPQFDAFDLEVTHAS